MKQRSPSSPLCLACPSHLQGAVVEVAGQLQERAPFLQVPQQHFPGLAERQRHGLVHILLALLLLRRLIRLLQQRPHASFISLPHSFILLG